MIVSTPVAAAAQNVEYRYQVQVDDPELVFGDVMTYSLTDGPASMSVDSATGLISWIPTDADPRKSDVTVRVEDGEGLRDTQTFSVTIGPEIYVVAAQDNGWLYFSRSFGDGTWRILDLDLYQAVKDVWPHERGNITELLFWTNYNAQPGDAFWIDDLEVVRRDYVSGFDVSRLPPTGGDGRGLDAGDYDGDGDRDLARARTSSGYIYLYTNDGNGVFTASSSQVADPGSDPYGVLMADFDNDGNQDVVAANYTSRQMLYFPGNGDATFGPAVLIGSTASNDLAIAAPAGRIIGQPFAVVEADNENIDAGQTVNFDASASSDDLGIASYELDWAMERLSISRPWQTTSTTATTADGR